MIVTETSMTSWPTTGWIAHTIPAENYWIELIGPYNNYEATTGQTVLMSTTGIEINSSNSPICGTQIAYATIYYNPQTDIYLSVDPGITVAHEVGHALGFGHTASTTSIMYSNGALCTAAQLSEDDIADYKEKY